jgi:hypothetical protein
VRLLCYASRLGPALFSFRPPHLLSTLAGDRPKRTRNLLQTSDVFIALRDRSSPSPSWRYGRADERGLYDYLSRRGVSWLLAIPMCLATESQRGFARISAAARPAYTIPATTVLSLPLLVGIPTLADAKQVVFALPLAAAVLVLMVQGIASRLALALPPIVALVVLIWYIPAGKTALMFLQQAEEGRSGKLVGLQVVQEEPHGSLSGWALGFGPANGLSRAAYMTDPTFARSDSAIRILELDPAPLPPVADRRTERVATGTSFNRPLSSAIGVLADTGLIGLIAFGWLMGSVVAQLWKRRGLWLAQAAVGGWALSLPLAVTFDWWEQPPFMLSLALLSALPLLRPPIVGRRVAEASTMRSRMAMWR